MTKNNIVGVILAGGLARRFGGGDKCLKKLGSKSILDHIISRMAPQHSELLINANGDPARFDPFNLEVIPDAIGNFAGPLAGILTGMEWAAKFRPDTEWITTIPSDVPFLPGAYVSSLYDAVLAGGWDLGRAASGGRYHPTCGIWRVRLATDLRSAMEENGIRKIDIWTARHKLVDVQFPTVPIDPFFNINSPEDLEEAKRILENQRC